MDDPIAQYIASPQVGQQAASVVQIESGKLVPLILMLSILCGLSIAFSVFTLNQARQSEREVRMLEYYLLEMDAKVIAAKIKTPEDSIAGKIGKQSGAN